jgi:putative (di)nucleoside polyphosphate hydrolase
MTDDHLYRRGVGVMLLNSENLVFVGRRIDNRDEAWQMPQGGIDEDEESWAAALREVQEETGIKPKLVERLASHPQQLRYDIPEAIASRLWGGKWRGQLQDWYLARFLGTDADVNIATKHPEFSHWKWVEPRLLPELIVPFKRDMYRAIVEGFQPYFD